MEAIECATHSGFSVVSMRRGVSTKLTKPCYINHNGKLIRVMSAVEGQDENQQYGHKQTKKLTRGGFKLHTGSKVI